MTTIITKRHKLKFYLSIAFAFVFFCLLGTLMAWVFFDSLKQGKLNTKIYFIPIFSFLLYFLALYTIYKYYRNAPIITIDKEKIKFGDKEIYYLKDIEHIQLTGKMAFPFIINFPMEGTALRFNNGTIKFFFDDMYSNSYQLKSFLEQEFVQKTDYIEIQTKNVDSNLLIFGQLEIFKGNQFTSFRGLSLWLMLIPMLYVLLFKINQSQQVGQIFFIAFILFWVSLHAWLMHYFGLTKDYFVIKNHIFLWKEHVYKISDIKEIVFETQGNQPNCLRVITKDFRNKRYPAGTLRKKTWLELQEKLEKEGIEVRNECIF